jgi:hypothetical protein
MSILILSALSIAALAALVRAVSQLRRLWRSVPQSNADFGLV